MTKYCAISVFGLLLGLVAGTASASEYVNVHVTQIEVDTVPAALLLAVDADVIGCKKGNFLNYKQSAAASTGGSDGVETIKAAYAGVLGAMLSERFIRLLVNQDSEGCSIERLYVCATDCK